MRVLDLDLVDDIDAEVQVDRFVALAAKWTIRWP